MNCTRCGQSLAGSLFRVATVDGERHELCPEPVQCFKCNMVAGHADGCPVSPTGLNLRSLRHENEAALRTIEALRMELAEVRAENSRLNAALLRGAA